MKEDASSIVEAMDVMERTQLPELSMRKIKSNLVSESSKKNRGAVDAG